MPRAVAIAPPTKMQINPIRKYLSDDLGNIGFIVVPRIIY